MSFLTTGFDLLAPGEYEFVISKVEKKTASSGNQMLALQLTVRSDVNQEGQKRKVFDNLVQTEKAMFKFNNLGLALFGKGVSFDTLEEFAKAIRNRPVKAKVKIEKDNHDQDRNTVMTYKATEFPYDDVYSEDEAFGGDDEGPAVSDDDLPF